jgi:hypothetical protein
VSQRDNRAHISYLFENIAPHSNHPDGFASRAASPLRQPAGSSAVDFFPGAHFGGPGLIKQCTLHDTSSIPLSDNLYPTDPISRASITMGKCSAQFQSHNFPFQLRRSFTAAGVSVYGSRAITGFAAWPPSIYGTTGPACGGTPHLSGSMPACRFAVSRIHDFNHNLAIERRRRGGSHNHRYNIDLCFAVAPPRLRYTASPLAGPLRSSPREANATGFGAPSSRRHAPNISESYASI